MKTDHRSKAKRVATVIKLTISKVPRMIMRLQRIAKQLVVQLPKLLKINYHRMATSEEDAVETMIEERKVKGEAVATIDHKSMTKKKSLAGRSVSNRSCHKKANKRKINRRILEGEVHGNNSNATIVVLKMQEPMLRQPCKTISKSSSPDNDLTIATSASTMRLETTNATMLLEDKMVVVEEVEDVAVDAVVEEAVVAAQEVKKRRSSLLEAVVVVEIVEAIARLMASKCNISRRSAVDVEVKTKVGKALATMRSKT